MLNWQNIFIGFAMASSSSSIKFFSAQTVSAEVSKSPPKYAFDCPERAFLETSGACVVSNPSPHSSPELPVFGSLRKKEAQILQPLDGIVNAIAEQTLFMDCACQGQLSQLEKGLKRFKKEQPENLQKLFEAQNIKKQTALHQAIEHHHESLALWLIQQGVESYAEYDWQNVSTYFLNKQDEKGQTPLHLSLSKGFTQVSLKILAEGAQIEKEDKFKRLPVHLAAMRHDQPVLNMLVEKRAWVASCDQYGKTPMDYLAMPWLTICFLYPELKGDRGELDEGFDLKTQGRHVTPLYNICKYAP
jgi:hypothetical protein